MSSVPCPSDFLCPINQTLMVDPVVAQDGNTYEREAISMWFRDHNTSPLSREVIRKDLIPNIRLRSMIQEYATANNIPLPKLTSPTQPDHPTTPFTSKDVPIITPNVSKGSSGETYISLTLSSPPTYTNPQHITVLIDTSGSMGESACRTEPGKENLGFTRLDFVKHALRTVVAALRPQDCLTLIEFNSTARMLMPFVRMDAINKQRAEDIIVRLHEGGGTNIYDALKNALTNLQNPVTNSYNNTVMLFTDGQASREFIPKDGIVKATKHLLSTLSITTPPTFHTYGFGYSLDTTLLHDISNMGHGSYHYIPDLTMIGTVFVNSIANILATTMNNVHLTYDCNLLEYVGSQAHITIPLTTAPRDVILHINTLSEAPQTHAWKLLDTSIIHDYPDPTMIPFKIQYGSYTYNYDLMAPSLEQHNALHVAPHPEAHVIVGRFTELLETLSEAWSVSLSNKVAFFRSKISTMPQGMNPLYDAILSEVTLDPQNPNVGQVALAVETPEAYHRWGMNHLTSLLSAHRKRTTHNFKDPSVQYYATPALKTSMEAISNLYADIPSPQPSRNHTIAAGTINMATLSLNPMDGCFGPDSLVYMADGTKKPAYAVKAGDIVLSLSNPNGTKVLCVVKTATNHRRNIMVKLNEELSLTPYHPVYISKKGECVWEFPVNMANQEIQDIPYVYNFVLQDGHHGIIVGGYKCATLGHGQINTPVLGHPYFAHKVVVDLKAMPGFKEGLVTFERLLTERDPVTGMISKWVMG